MNCSRLETLLSEYMDEALDPRVRVAVELHLDRCSACSSLLTDVRQVRTQLTEFPIIEPSDALLESVIERTTGKFRVRSLWGDFVVPTLRPFMTQRFVFATLIMFVFLSLLANVIGPDFSALSFSDLRPSALAERADRFSSQVYRKWLEVRGAQARVVGEIWRLKEDLYGRLDYHLVNMLLRNYQQSVDKEGAKKTSGQTDQRKK
jgi:hypothetical protein